MSREILFKAQRVDNGEWVEGLLTKKYGDYEADEINANGLRVKKIMTTKMCVQEVFDNKFNRMAGCEVINEIREFEVNPATVCQYTGLKDKNGVKIFEGDKLARASGFYTVKWDHDSAGFKKTNGNGGVLSLDDCECEVTGNIHDKEGE